ncbi:predicted protein [Uncinocarpus reesii 1704]|uniref:Uncharacterized protein n=1 Tax=Uncinocarpus reesii (strain UAMH 1704) TaxID=336963 RepID=C4JHU2_UNCRE|nr:uncharacterized protein UREG_02778 [Uncinocarpus reesii 1704]EEP77929.1 predicted protein [Uncinocarpus reesii 1704]
MPEEIENRKFLRLEEEEKGCKRKKKEQTEDCWHALRRASKSAWRKKKKKKKRKRGGQQWEKTKKKINDSHTNEGIVKTTGLRTHTIEIHQFRRLHCRRHCRVASTNIVQPAAGAMRVERMESKKSKKQAQSVLWRGCGGRIAGEKCILVVDGLTACRGSHPCRLRNAPSPPPPSPSRIGSMQEGNPRLFKKRDGMSFPRRIRCADQANILASLVQGFNRHGLEGHSGLEQLHVGCRRATCSGIMSSLVRPLGRKGLRRTTAGVCRVKKNAARHAV